MALKALKREHSIVFIMLCTCITAVFGANYLFSNLYYTNFMVVMALLYSMVLLSVIGFNFHSRTYGLSIFVSLIAWVSGIVVAMEYSIPLFAILSVSLYTIVPLILYFAIRQLLQSRLEVDSFLHYLLITALVCNVISFIEYYLSFRGIDLLHMNVYSRMRDGTPRFIVGEVVIVYGYFISIADIISKDAIENRLLCIINVVATVINMVVIVKTRSMFIYLLATTVAIPLITGESNIFAKMLSIAAVLAILFLGLFTDSIVRSYASIVSDTGVQTRFDTISYYVDLIFKHPLFGYGYIPASPNYSTYSLVSGPLGRYYISDVGIIGLAFRNGIVGLIWLVLWYFEGIRYKSLYRDSLPGYYNTLLNLMLIYLLVSCINLIMTDAPRFPYISITMALVEASCYFNRPMANTYN